VARYGRSRHFAMLDAERDRVSGSRHRTLDSNRTEIAL